MNPLWTAIKGAKRWATAWAKGDRATKEDARARAAACGRCVTLTVHRVPALGAFAAFCGPPPVPGHRGAPGRYCSCLRGWVPPEQAKAMEREAGGDRQQLERLIRQNMRPAGANTVGSYPCPQSKEPHPKPGTPCAGCKGSQR